MLVSVELVTPLIVVVDLFVMTSLLLSNQIISKKVDDENMSSLITVQFRLCSSPAVIVQEGDSCTT